MAMGDGPGGVGVDWQHKLLMGGRTVVEGVVEREVKSCKCRRTNSNNNKRNWIGMTTAETCCACIHPTP